MSRKPWLFVAVGFSWSRWDLPIHVLDYEKGRRARSDLIVQQAAQACSDGNVRAEMEMHKGFFVSHLVIQNGDIRCVCITSGNMLP